MARTFSVKEAARELGLAPSSVYALVSSRRISCHRLPVTPGSKGKITFTEDDLQRYLDSTKVDAEVADTAPQPIHRLKHIGV